MDWELVDSKGDLIQMVNCQYDAIDIGRMLYNAEVICLDFSTQKATIVKYDEEKGDE